MLVILKEIFINCDASSEVDNKDVNMKELLLINEEAYLNLEKGNYLIDNNNKIKFTSYSTLEEFENSLLCIYGKDNVKKFKKNNLNLYVSYAFYDSKEKCIKLDDSYKKTNMILKWRVEELN